MPLFVIFRGRHLEISELDWNDWGATYPSVDIEREFRMMDDWLESNPRRRKKNYRRFITNWLKAEERRARVTKAEQNVGSGHFEGVKVRPEILERERQRQAKAERR
jgi:hypothetical protein